MNADRGGVGPKVDRCQTLAKPPSPTADHVARPCVAVAKRRHENLEIEAARVAAAASARDPAAKHGGIVARAPHRQLHRAAAGSDGTKMASSAAVAGQRIRVEIQPKMTDFAAASTRPELRQSAQKDFVTDTGADGENAEVLHLRRVPEAGGREVV